MSDSAFVLTINLLGFGRLIERDGDDIGAGLLGYRFANFQRCLKQALIRLQDTNAGTAIVLSDSACFSTDSLDDAVNLACSLMSELVTSEVPVRMGLARGSFRVLNALQFLGTGVVRAHRTERCGLGGLRILIHPDLESLTANARDAFRIVPVEPTAPLRLDVRSEVNYLQPAPDSRGPDFDDVELFRSLKTMSDVAAEDFQYHYLQTFNAWNAMRAQLGRQPYPWEKYRSPHEYAHTHGRRGEPHS